MTSLFSRAFVQYMSVCLLCLVFCGFAVAAPVRFEVTVNPNPFKVSEFADVTVKAMDANGNVDPSYTDGDIWIEIEGLDYTDPDVVLPGGGIGLFEPADQGVKIFSKGLTVKRAGTYTLTIADVYDTTLQGSTEIEVLADSDGPEVSGVNVISPVAGSVEKDASVEVIGTTTFANTPLEIFVDGVSLQKAISDQNKDFIMFLSGLQPGEHVLKINALDLEDKVVATSGDIPFRYEPETGDLFLGLQIDPGTTVEVDEKLTFTLSTAERVTSAFIRLGNGEMLPTEKIQPGMFRKQIALGSAGQYPVDVQLSVDGNETTYEDEDTITVLARELPKRILTLDYTTDDTRKKADLVWTYTGSIDYFKVNYGTNRDNLRLSLTTVNPMAMLVLADATIPYYAQIFPVDENGVVNGDPSGIITIPPLLPALPVCGDGIVAGNEQCDDGNSFNGDGCSAVCTIEQPIQPLPVCGDGRIESGEQCDDGNIMNGDGCNAACRVEIAPPQLPDPTCNPSGIPLQSRKVGDQYYIFREPVLNATEYIVYRSDQAVSTIQQMAVVGRTIDTMFEYPFDPYSETDKWAWYAVEAVCVDNTQKQVGDMTTVKVGPEKTFLILFLAAIIGFMGWRMVKT